MNFLIYILLLIPLAIFFGTLLFSNKNEKSIYFISIAGIGLNYLLLISILAFWISNGFEPLILDGPTFYEAGNSSFGLNFMLDGYGFAYLFTATFLTAVIINFSRTYVHREKGFKRFYNNIIFFYFGLVLVLLAGNLETIFIGWEILGITSFFLIGFYRNRYLPVKNALKVVSLYRLADVAILLGIWLSHHYFGHSVNFYSMEHLSSSHAHVLDNEFYKYAIPSLFLLAAMIKSAQFPFSSWLPRAMEGPTTSTSIFYGSLSAHIGVFLLIRTAPFWENNYWFHFIIGGIGLLTAVVCTFIARVQPSIKTEIAYSSSTQVGVMFIEVSLGLYWLAIIHFIGNAMLRSHQLLISPSILSYRIHDLNFHFKQPQVQGKRTFLDRLKLSIYILSVKEFNLDTFMYKYLWNPFKSMGHAINFLSLKVLFSVSIIVFSIGFYALNNPATIPADLEIYLPIFYAFFSFLIILKSFVERKSSANAWGLIIANQIIISLALGFNEKLNTDELYIYLSGIVVSSIIGGWVIFQLHKKKYAIDLNEFHGHIYELPGLALLFLLACLGLLGFPITPTFIGEELLLNHLHENQFFLLILVFLNLILVSLAIFRLYSRLFRGQHKSDYHDFAYRSS